LSSVAAGRPEAGCFDDTFRGFLCHLSLAAKPDQHNSAIYIFFFTGINCYLPKHKNYNIEDEVMGPFTVGAPKKKRKGLKGYLELFFINYIYMKQS